VTKVCTFSDLHLKHSSPYDREPGDRLEDQVRVGQRIVEIARERECSLILNAGDTFEGPIVQPEEYAAYLRAFAEIGSPMITLLGNGRHDLAKRSVSAPSIVGDVQLAPGIVVKAGVVIACLPWCPIDRLVAARNGGERADINREAAAHLISIAQELRRECAEKFPDLPAILLGHWSVEGGVTATGAETISFAEPILPLADLEALGFAAVFMGHVHKPQQLGQYPSGHPSDNGRPIIIPGSPLPLSFGEAGDHGVWIFDTDSGACEFVPIESRAFVTLDRDWSVTPEAGLSDPMDIFGYGDDLSVLQDAIIRVRYTATAEQAKRIDQRKLRDALYAAGAHKVYAIEANVERETRARVAGAREDLDVSEALDLWITSQEIDVETAERLHDRTRQYVQGERS
jgi:exonuclease SbcD